MKRNESMEDYLETILILSRKLPAVRGIDIANELDFSKPSVSIAMKKLRETGYITVTELGSILLTESGRAVAEHVYERHSVLTAMLERLGVTPAVAAEDACRIEHDLSQESFDAIKAHLEHFPS